EKYFCNREVSGELLGFAGFTEYVGGGSTYSVKGGLVVRVSGVLSPDRGALLTTLGLVAGVVLIAGVLSNPVVGSGRRDQHALRREGSSIAGRIQGDRQAGFLPNERLAFGIRIQSEVHSSLRNGASTDALEDEAVQEHPALHGRPVRRRFLIRVGDRANCR